MKVGEIEINRVYEVNHLLKWSSLERFMGVVVVDKFDVSGVSCRMINCNTKDLKIGAHLKIPYESFVKDVTEYYPEVVV